MMGTGYRFLLVDDLSYQLGIVTKDHVHPEVGPGLTVLPE